MLLVASLASLVPAAQARAAAATTWARATPKRATWATRGWGAHGGAGLGPGLADVGNKQLSKDDL